MKTKKTVGTFFELGSCNAMECLCAAGFDYVIIDTEHGPFSEESTADFIRAAENRNVLPFVRIGGVSRPLVLRMLDIGARGLIVPNIKTVQEVRELVSYAKFTPIGQRGFCPTRTSAWGSAPWSADIEAYMKECNKRCLVIPQCETKEALDSIEEIAAIKGVDGIFIGPFDLSLALGVPGQFFTPVMQNAIKRILDACKKHRKKAYIFASTPEMAQKFFAMGADSVTCGLDAGMLISAAKSVFEDCKKDLD
ncbi:MAG: hypothetical protein GX684_01450 [Ruminococcaceae bacterium]|nr:hypothetical protein [Oscillospiraceae bacterium]